VYGFLYYVLYFTILLPLKLFSLVTVLNNSWVTPSRHQRFRCLPSCSWDARLALVLIFFWNCIVVISVGRLVINHNDVTSIYRLLST
jgi:membrane-anchored glycerophosphoryl diester phosphodiesterase (GDPDase)